MTDMKPGQIARNCLSLADNTADPEKRAELRAEAAVWAQLETARQLEEAAENIGRVAWLGENGKL